jgi:hypothetical protein
VTTPIPAAPGPGWSFVSPPGWTSPQGFDPGRGHVVDPTWPDAPEGWQFWTKPAVPAAARDNVFARIGWWRIALGALAIILLVSRFTGTGSSSPATGVGSCWKLANGTSYTPVECADSSATVQVVSQTSDPSTCNSNGPGFLDSQQDGPTRYQCLKSVSH